MTIKGTIYAWQSNMIPFPLFLKEECIKYWAEQCWGKHYTRLGLKKVYWRWGHISTSMPKREMSFCSKKLLAQKIALDTAHLPSKNCEPILSSQKDLFTLKWKVHTLAKRSLPSSPQISTPEQVMSSCSSPLEKKKEGGSSMKFRGAEHEKFEFWVLCSNIGISKRRKKYAFRLCVSCVKINSLMAI